MTLEQLKAFQAIVTQGTFTKAAKVLHKAQPALSVMIKNLEEECGIQLFSREGYRPVLTPAGRQFYEKTLAVLDGVTELKGLAQRLSGEEEPVLRLAINAVCPLPALLPTLKEIDDRYATHLEVSSEMLGGAQERLLEGQADLAITWQTDPPAILTESFPLLAVTILPVAHKDHPAARGGLKSEATMRNYNQIIVADSSSKQKQSLNVLQGGKKWVVTDIAAKKDILMAGMGWGGLPEYFIADELQQGSLVPLEVEGFPIRQFQLYAMRRTDKPKGIVNEALWQALKALRRIDLTGTAGILPAKRILN